MKSIHKSNVRINGGRVVVPVYVSKSAVKNNSVLGSICFKRVFAGILVGGCTLVAGCIAFLYI